MSLSTTCQKIFFLPHHSTPFTCNNHVSAYLHAVLSIILPIEVVLLVSGVLCSPDPFFCFWCRHVSELILWPSRLWSNFLSRVLSTAAVDSAYLIVALHMFGMRLITRPRWVWPSRIIVWLHSCVIHWSSISISPQPFVANKKCFMNRVGRSWVVSRRRPPTMTDEWSWAVPYRTFEEVSGEIS